MSSLGAFALLVVVVILVQSLGSGFRAALATKPIKWCMYPCKRCHVLSKAKYLHRRGRLDRLVAKIFFKGKICIL